MIFTLTSETGPLLTKFKIWVPESAYVLREADPWELLFWVTIFRGLLAEGFFVQGLMSMTFFLLVLLLKSLSDVQLEANVN